MNKFQAFFNNLSQKERKVFYFAVAAVLLALFDRLLVGPSMGQIAKTEQEIEKQKIMTENDLRILAHKDRIEQEFAALDQYFTAQMPSEDVIKGDFLRTIEDVASRANVKLVKRNPTEVVEKDFYYQYFASLECLGEIESVITFMHMLNSTEDLLKIVEFNMTPKRGTANEVSATMTVEKVVILKDSKVASL